jgi:hypothetical protein
MNYESAAIELGSELRAERKKVALPPDAVGAGGTPGFQEPKCKRSSADCQNLPRDSGSRARLAE